MSGTKLQFGHVPPGRALDRPGAYALVFDAQQRILACVENGRLYLPGGGIEPGETPVAAVAREVREETGFEIVDPVELAAARQYVVDGRGVGVNKVCTFFTARLGAEVGPAEHENGWFAVDEALSRFAEDASAWAVRQATAGGGPA